jgi:hypothetical protein
MRIAELVKTYRAINDPKAPPWSVKFVGAIFLLAVLVGGFVAIAYSAHHQEAPNVVMATTQANADGTRTDYVGYAPNAFDPTHRIDSGTAEQQLQAWKDAHPGALVLKESPRTAAGQTIGYDVTYRA